MNIRNDDITDGNPKLTLGLIWTIILHFQISDIHVTGESEDMSAKERLLLWTQQATEGYAGIRCENFTTCWRDGKLFNAIIHKYRYGICEILSLDKYEFFSFPHFKITFYYYKNNTCTWQKIRKYRQVKVKTSHFHHSEISPLSAVHTRRPQSCNMFLACASNLADSKL